MDAKPNLTIIRNNLSHKDRIQARIDSFARDIMSGDGDMDYIEQILAVIYDYMLEYDDDDVVMAAFKIKEACFYVGNFLSY